MFCETCDRPWPGDECPVCVDTSPPKKKKKTAKEKVEEKAEETPPEE